MVLTQQFFSTPRGRLGAYIASNPNRPQLLCLHGGPGFDSVYLHCLKNSLGKNFELIFLDQRGDGLSGCLVDALNHSLADYADDVLMVAASIRDGSRRIGLLGHSFGGFVALKALGHSAAASDFGIVTNTAVDLSWATECEKNSARLNISPRAAELEGEIFAGRGTDDMFREMTMLYAPMYYPELPREDGEQLLAQGKYSVATYRNAGAHIYPGMDLQLDCRRIRTPCLVLGGERDYVTPWSCQAAIESFIPQSTAYCFSDAGHFPFVTRAEEFGRVVQEWYHTLGKA